MKNRKKVKFPFEVTKGQAEDLFRLRFMRRSELEPNVRHNLRSNVCQMGRQLDVWFKEQLFTIGSVSREQDKVFKSFKFLKRESRRSKRRQYAYLQEEIRIKLNSIKKRMIIMKVVQKFRENVMINKALRGEIVPDHHLKAKVDFLRLAENQQYLQSAGASGQDDIYTRQDSDSDVNARVDHSLTRGDENQDLNNGVGDPTTFSPTDNVNDDSLYKYGDNSFPAVAKDSISEQRRMSSAGQRMETIPEEAEVEVEINDVTGMFYLLTLSYQYIFSNNPLVAIIMHVNDKRKNIHLKV